MRQEKSDERKQVGGADALLDAREAAAFLRVRLSTIRQWTYQRRLPVVKPFGRVARYRRHDLERLVEQWTRPALTEYDGSRS